MIIMDSFIKDLIQCVVIRDTSFDMVECCICKCLCHSLWYNRTNQYLISLCLYWSRSKYQLHVIQISVSFLLKDPFLARNGTRTSADNEQQFA